MQTTLISLKFSET